MMILRHPGDIDDTLGGRIVQAREAMNLSTAQLARRLGVHSKTLANWERDRAEPRANRIVNLAGMLNVSPSWLIGGRGSAPDLVSRSDELIQLRSKLDRITELHQTLGEAIQMVDNAVNRLTRSSPED